MAIDFSFPEETQHLIAKVHEFCTDVVKPCEERIDAAPDDRDTLVSEIITMRKAAKEAGLWLPHMPEEYGGMGLGHVEMAAVSAEAAKTRFGPFALNAQAPDEGNMHTLHHWATPEQKEKYLKPLCDGRSRSCFAMTEPEVAGSDPTLIQTRAVRDGDDWVINGHKWFISGAKGAKFAILIARTEEDPEIPQAANSAFLVDIPSEGWEIVRDVHTMSGGHNHCEIRITDLRVPDSAMLGGPGQGHLLGQARLGPARLAHCMRWIGQAETALNMGIERAIRDFYSPEKKISIYVFGDEFTGGSYEAVVSAVDAVNREDSSGNRLVRIHAVGFPVQFERPPHLQTTGIRFATLMRELTHRNGGTFVGLNDFRR